MKIKRQLAVVYWNCDKTGENGARRKEPTIRKHIKLDKEVELDAYSLNRNSSQLLAKEIANNCPQIVEDIKNNAIYIWGSITVSDVEQQLNHTKISVDDLLPYIN